VRADDRAHEVAEVLVLREALLGPREDELGDLGFTTEQRDVPVVLRRAGAALPCETLALTELASLETGAREAEELLNGAPANNQTFQAAAEAALRDPFTVPGTAFKVELAQRTIVRILETVSGVQS